MEFINVQTTQNVAIGYPIAGLGDRYLAALIDYFIFFAYLMFIGIVIQYFDFWRYIEVNTFLLLFIFLPISFYHPLCEIFLDGQSVGKMARKIKVVKVDGTQISLVSYLLRWLFRLVDILITFGGLAVVCVLITKNGQRLGDIVANTTVVSLKQYVSLEDNLLFQTDNSYIVQYPEARNLSDRDIATIKEVLKRHSELTDNQMLYELYGKVSELLRIYPDENQSVENFLRTIVSDYNHIHST